MTRDRTVDEDLAEPQSSQAKLIRADILIPGHKEPVKDGALVFNPGEPILFAGAYDDLPEKYRKERMKPTLHVPVLMPGLWDCHVHLTGSETVPLDDMLFADKALCGARVSRDLAALLNAGFTSVRELAGYGWAARRAVAEGWIPGPTVYSSVSMLSMTAGHGDANKYPLAAAEHAMCDGNFFEVCDGPDGCVRAVRKKLRQGADIIKVAASGGVLSHNDDPRHQQFGPEELAAIVAEARRAGRIVTAHCHGKPGIVAALEAGVRCIEHGTFLDDETIGMMLDVGALLVATRSISQFGVEHPEAMPPEVYRKMLEVDAIHRAAYAKAVRAGVRCALGTDMGVSSDKVAHRHGMNARELKFAVDAGMTPAQAIEAMTATAPETLGPEMAPRSGRLQEGYDADFIAVAGNPLDDGVEVLMDTANVTHVWKTGRLYKKPGRDVGLFPLTLDE